MGNREPSVFDRNPPLVTLEADRHTYYAERRLGGVATVGTYSILEESDLAGTVEEKLFAIDEAIAMESKERQDEERLRGRFESTREYVTRPVRSTADYYLAMVTFRRLRGESDGPLPQVQNMKLSAIGKEMLG